MMQMLKQATLPRSVIMRSNDGKRIAIPTKMTIVRTRSMILRHPRLSPDMPSMEDDMERERVSRPKRTSSVLTIGRAFNGIFVNGMMAMQMAMKTLIPSGKPAVRKMLLVISSLTPLPNIRIPAHAMPTSSMYVKMYVTLTALRYLYG
jgi:hypothetical protein